MINCSFGNGWRTTKVPRYKEVMIEAARSLATRFREKPGIIQSWDVTRGWQSERGWECPVIIDNMMNLELLFEATKLSGDSTFYHIAVNHADRTLKEHFRTNGSCYHVIDIVWQTAWYGIDKQPKDMQTNRLGVVDKHGRFMVTLCVTGKLMIKSI